MEFLLREGALIYRVASGASGRAVNSFNPGVGRPTRFAFFGTPVVPALYAADTPEAAVCETLLHDIPANGGVLTPRDYQDKVMGRLRVSRALVLASFMGTGLKALRVEASDITTTTATRYPETVKWAVAAHEAGFDGVAWMSGKCNTDRAYMFFGDRVAEEDLAIDPEFARLFELEADRTWLTEFCSPLHIDVRW
ncbi:RES family NAD+ phosphorylase [Specibacter cremeus]|uniref:RES family NAD+ phosphorylase n=1 Tax=Specibacter cremeus TaxID=1629051 RepID=UPI0023E7F5BF|nr:RES family NAD+ phosphorylase [Specibacter cremeus]